MDIDATFLPVAIELIDTVFPTAIVYNRDNGSSYDPATGIVTPSVTQYNINAGILSRGATEEGGSGETQELRFWIQHSGSGLPVEATTGDTVLYLGRTYKVTSIEPVYSSKAIIASKITARAS